MNIMMKTLLSTAAFVGFMGVAHANKSGHVCGPEGSDTLCDSSSIPVSLVINPNCDITVTGGDIAMIYDPNDSTSLVGTSKFNITANAKYKVLVDSDNRKLRSLPIGNETDLIDSANSNTSTNTIAATVATSGAAGTLTLGQKSNYTASASASGGDVYNVTYTAHGLSASQKAGTYSDVYTIDVYF